LIRLDSSRSLDRRWSLARVSPTTVLRCESDTFITTLRCGNDAVGSWTNPLDALQWLDREGRIGGDGRWVGLLSYDLGRLFENLPSRAADDLHTPLFAFVACPQECVIGRTRKPRLDENFLPPACLQPISTFTPDSYRSAVDRVIDYIRAGDIFQANLAQRFTLENTASPAAIYQRLLRSSPASYGGLLDFGDFALICNSPELFVRVTPNPETGKRHIITRPIKGTRPRLPGQDLQLRDSIKDQAELNMIVDLERNDLGRICEIGSIRVSEPRTIETHPTVYHGVASIEGVLRDDVSFVDLLRATFPGGSITGAPKIRAMEIIEELEPVRRGPYCGAIGYLAGDGSIEFNVAIRTMIAKNGQIHIPVGGGIVADSDPDAEYQETLVKARAMFAALGVSVDPASRAGL